MKKYIYNSIVVSAVLLSLTACGGSDNSGSPVTNIGMKRASTLVLSDFGTSDVKLTKAEFIVKLNKQYDFFFNDPTSKSASGTFTYRH